MATTDTIQGTTKNGSGANVTSKYATWIVWKVNSTNITNNTSNITITVYTQRADDWTGESAYCLTEYPEVTLKVDGVRKEPDKYNFMDTRNHKLCDLAIWTGNVTHNSDGTKNLSITCNWTVANSYLASGSTSGTAKLNPITRLITVTSATNFTDEENPTITFTNPSGIIYQPIMSIRPVGNNDKELFNFTGVKQTTASPRTITLSDTQRENLRESCNDAAEYTAWLGVRMYESDGITYLDNHQLKRKLTIVNAEPAVSRIAAAPVDCPDWAGSIFIQGVTSVDATMTYNFKKNAYLKECTLTVEGTTYTASAIAENGANVQTSKLLGSGKIKLECKVTDSRGLTGTMSREITVSPYEKPFIARHSQYDRIVCERCDSSGKYANNGKNLHIALSKKWSPLTNNTNVAKLEYKIQTTGYDSGWLLLSDTSQGTNGSHDINTVYTDTELAVDKAYTVTFRCKDKFDNITTHSEKIPTEEVVFHLKEGGGGAAFGEYATEDKVLKLKDDWDLKLKGWNVVDFVILEAEPTADNKHWNYRVWNSGKAEAWKILNPDNVSLTTQMATGVYSNSTYKGCTVKLPPYLFVKNSYGDEPMAFINAYGSAYLNSQISVVNSEKEFLECRVWAPYSAEVSNCKIAFYLIGRWKT